MSGFPWDGSEIVKKQYEKDNYSIIYNNNNTKRVIVFFWKWFILS